MNRLRKQTVERVSAGFMSGYLANVNTPGKENFNPRGVFMFALPRHLPAIGGKIIPSIYPRISGDINAYYLFLFSAASLNSFKAAANFIEDADGFPRKYFCGRNSYVSSYPDVSLLIPSYGCSLLRYVHYGWQS